MSKVKVKETKEGMSATPGLYTPRPVPVEALRYTETNRPELLDFIASRAAVSSDGPVLVLRTAGATVTIHLGDWLVYRGGNFSSLDDVSFHASYEKK